MVKFSVYLNGRVFIMGITSATYKTTDAQTKKSYNRGKSVSMAQLDMRPTGDQAVAVSTPDGSATFFR